MCLSMTMNSGAIYLPCPWAYPPRPLHEVCCTSACMEHMTNSSRHHMHPRTGPLQLRVDVPEQPMMHGVGPSSAAGAENTSPLATLPHTSRQLSARSVPCTVGRIRCTHTALEGIAPEGIAPEGIAPEGIAPEGIAPEEIAPEEIAPEGIAPGCRF